MLTLKSSFRLGTVLSWITCTIIYPLSAQAQTPSPGIPEESLLPLVTQMSDQLATKISTSSCQDIRALLAQAQASSSQTPDSNSIIAQTLVSVRNSPKLKGIIISKLGEPMITKMIDCNLIPVEALMAPSTTTPTTPTTPSPQPGMTPPSSPTPQPLPPQ